MANHYKITEQGKEYSLGKIKDNIIHYDLVKTLSYLDVKGKMLFGTHFKIYEEDFKTIYKLLIYIIRDKENCKKHNINLNKGILLTGPIGCGKTSLMSLIRHIVPKERQYQMHSARNISFEYQKDGHQVIENYNNTKSVCFDDLGIEQNLKHYGNSCNVLGEILLSRYDLWISHIVITHATTNLNAQELEEWYGNRVRSRMRQLFNLVAFDKQSNDKRN